jgi:hypothetical protein
MFGIVVAAGWNEGGYVREAPQKADQWGTMTDSCLVRAAPGELETGRNERPTSVWAHL